MANRPAPRETKCESCGRMFMARRYPVSMIWPTRCTECRSAASMAAAPEQEKK